MFKHPQSVKNINSRLNTHLVYLFLKMFLAFKHHRTVLGIFNGKMAFKRYMEFSDNDRDTDQSLQQMHVNSFDAYPSRTHPGLCMLLYLGKNMQTIGI